MANLTPNNAKSNQQYENPIGTPAAYNYSPTNSYYVTLDNVDVTVRQTYDVTNATLPTEPTEWYFLDENEVAGVMEPILITEEGLAYIRENIRFGIDTLNMTLNEDKTQAEFKLDIMGVYRTSLNDDSQTPIHIMPFKMDEETIIVDLDTNDYDPESILNVYGRFKIEGTAPNDALQPVNPSGDFAEQVKLRVNVLELYIDIDAKDSVQVVMPPQN